MAAPNVPVELDAYYLSQQLIIPDGHGSGSPVQAFIRGSLGVVRITRDGPVVVVEREAGPTLEINGLCIGVRKGAK